MVGANELPGKHEVARSLLLKGTLFVHLDPRCAEVEVPPWLKRQPQLVLQVGLDMPMPIPDLRVDDEGVYGTLSFSRRPFSCSVPWDAVFALAGDDGRGMVWPASMPEEIAAEVAREAGRGRQRTTTGKSSRPVDDAAVRDSAAHDAFDAMSSRQAARRSPLRAIPQRPAPPGAAAPRDSDALDASPGPQARRRVLPPYLRVVK
jgi:hypothetical protein